ncbi:MAG TPA: 4Fe-4S binding protein, partial [Spirochaetia bacterium]|nr:4Fe-4S binding protein [Spirochaetia bacterium]
MKPDAINIILEKCTACKLCEKVCPYDAIHVIEKKAVVDEKCTLCGACLGACKFDAIIITRRTFKGQDIASYSGICVFAENRFGKLSSVVPEIIGAARELQKELPRPISAILLGHNISALADELVTYGVNEVWVIDSPKIGDFAEDVQTELAAQIILDKKPEIFLGGGTVIGRSLLPRIAAKLLTGLTADCTELTIDKETKRLVQTRPAFGGNIMATILCKNHRPQMATVRHKVMKPAGKLEKADGKI